MYATDSFILRKNGYEMLVVVDITALVEIKSAMFVSLFYSSLSAVLNGVKSMSYFRFTFCFIQSCRCLHISKKYTPLFFVKSDTAVFKVII